MFFDLVQHGVGVCSKDDIAVSVLASVVGAKPEKGWILVDAGWMALSRDRGTASQRVDQGYGVVCDETGRILEDVIVSQASQEHGILSIRPGSGKTMPAPARRLAGPHPAKPCLRHGRPARILQRRRWRGRGHRGALGTHSRLVTSAVRPKGRLEAG